MRCKVGDLAVYVGMDVRDLGQIVRVIEFFHAANGPGWVIEPPLQRFDKSAGIVALDTSLRPIRDSKGEDEILRITGRPHEMPVEIIKRETERQS